MLVGWIDGVFLLSIGIKMNGLMMLMVLCVCVEVEEKQVTPWNLSTLVMGPRCFWPKTTSSSEMDLLDPKGCAQIAASRTGCTETACG